MPNSSRFPLAVELLVLLSEVRPNAMTSEAIAASVGGSAVVIRRLVTRLNAARLTTAQMGRGGGVTLATSPKKITLLDIYRAVEDGPLISRASKASAIASSLDAELARAEHAFEATLKSSTLKQIARRAGGQVAT